MKLNEPAERVSIMVQGLSVMKSGRAKAVGFSTRNSICQALDCSCGEILRYAQDV